MTALRAGLESIALPIVAAVVVGVIALVVFALAPTLALLWWAA